MNDVSLNWKRIRRTLPRSRRYAIDRIPTLEEIREILDAADIRGKALTLLFLSSGVREGAIEYFQIHRDPYERPLLNFLDYVKLSPDEFVTLGRNQPATVEKKVMSFMLSKKQE